MGQRKRWEATKVVTVDEAISKELYAKLIQELSNALYQFFTKANVDEKKEVA